MLVVRLIFSGTGSAFTLENYQSAATILVPADQPTIQDALDAAVGGDEIVVSPGTYVENIDFLGKAVTLRASDPDPAVTIIDGSGGFDSVVMLVSGEGQDSVLDGFTITGGSGTRGGGADIDNGSPTIRNCVFECNDATLGGGIRVVDGSPLIADCTFRRNHGNGGGGIYVYNSSPLISGCVFGRNDATTGGGVSCILGDPMIVDCRFRNNSATNGGGLYVGSGSLVVNCLIRDNSATSAGGITVVGDATLVNCTIVSQTLGGGVLVNSAAHLVAVNSIMYGNASYDLQVNGTATVEYSNVAGGYAGTGNIDALPVFVDRASNDYRLDAGSPCIDAASNAAVPVQVDADLDGNARFINDPITPDTGNGTAPLVDMGVLPGPGR